LFDVAVSPCPALHIPAQRLTGHGGQQLKEICVLGGPGGPLSGVLKPVRSLLAIQLKSGHEHTQYAECLLPQLQD
jgi:hypothetical protein